MKEKLKDLWWIWPFANTLLFLVILGMRDVDKQIVNERLKGIDENRQKIEQIQYHLDQQPDTVVIVNNNNIYIKKK